MQQEESRVGGIWDSLPEVLRWLSNSIFFVVYCNMKYFKTVLMLLFVVSTACKAAETTKLLRQPALSEDHLAFVYAGDLWIADADGADPRRLTSHPAIEKDPVFSPDGKWIAFSAVYDGNRDVYVISVDGGQPRRLTWHPYTDVPQYWSADGQYVYFASGREADHGRSRQLYKVSVDGGAPTKEMEARFFQGQVSADGDLAYIIYMPAYNGLFGYSSGWKGYRGGTAPEIQIMDADKTQVSIIPGEGSVNFNPLWIDGKVYFLSDRDDKIFNLYEWNPEKEKLKKLTENDLWDIRWASASGDTIAYESGGELHLFDLKKKKTKTLSIAIAPDLPQLRKGWKNAASTLQSLHLSKTGKRALLTARGEVFTVPVEDGSTRNLSRTGDTHEYGALWSPDGMQIAWIEENKDRTGQSVIISDQFGEIEKRLDLGSHFYTLRAWVKGETSQLLYSDNHLGLHLMDLDSATSRPIAYNARRAGYEVAVSPDANWIAYTLEQPNYHADLMLYQIASGESHLISDGMADVSSPVFSQDGSYLYFLASTNAGPVQIGLNMTSQERPVRSGIYAAILAADGKSPLLPKSGDEEAGSSTDETEEVPETVKEDKESTETFSEADASGEKNTDEPKPASEVSVAENAEEEALVVDLEGIQSRIISLPVAERRLANLEADKDGNLYYISYTQPGIANLPPGGSLASENTLLRFDFEEKEEAEWLPGVNSLVMSADRSHLLIVKHDGSMAVSPVGKKPDAKPLNTSGCKVYVDPREEWGQIFDEAWRMEKEYFYADNLHNLDWDAVYDQYQPLVKHVGSREDLNELMVEMIAELHAGHNRVYGGDVYEGESVAVGLLGCNFVIEEGRYRVSKIYSGAAWTPYQEGPLAVPGNEVKAGDFIIAVDHVDLTDSDNLFERLQNTIGKQVTLTVSVNADGSEPRDIVVEPAHYNTTSSLRLWEWVESNRRYVAQKTDGKVGYIYLPNTAGDGYDYFNRMFFPQVNKEALIIDERSNGGGQAADYIIETLARKHLSGWKDRDGLIYNTPSGAHHGPKLMMIDQDAGSGGDYLPFMFRYTGAGKLLGTRTWGGLIGIATNPQLMDGGGLTVPFFRFFDADNQWSVENEGVAPDIEVALDPIATNAGVDSQLDAAIAEILTQLEAFTPTVATEAPALPTVLGE
jgi:tricorn protease